MIENNFPEKLLYYSKIDKHCVDVILRNTFAITDPTRGFNDPLDCFFELDYRNLDKDEIIGLLRGLFVKDNYLEKGVEIAGLTEGDRRIIDSYRDELVSGTKEALIQKLSEFGTKTLRNLMSRFLRIRCFSAQASDRTLNNIMFSHYGDSHKGLCYMFDSKKLIADDLLGSFIEVEYLHEPALIKYNYLGTHSEEELVQIYKQMVKVKYRTWKYETEWRLIINLLKPSKNIYETWKFEPDALEGIVLGLETTTEDEERIKELVGKRTGKVNVYKAMRRHGSFCIDYEENKIN